MRTLKRALDLIGNVLMVALLFVALVWVVVELVMLMVRL